MGKLSGIGSFRQPRRFQQALRAIGVAALAAVASAASLDVPFVKQEKNGCGAAAVWMLMSYWRGAGAPAHDSILREIYKPEAAGVYASEMERYLRLAGFETFAFRGEWPDLEQHIAKGRPLVVALGKSPAHYVVIAGVEADTVSLNDPARRKLIRLDRKSFERNWTAADRWTLLAVPRQ
jgi:ABC-type bacteriocin/lantibiotic exporter with double-glycine peptidase domain